jgi:hypothetical protein
MAAVIRQLCAVLAASRRAKPLAEKLGGSYAVYPVLSGDLGHLGCALSSHKDGLSPPSNRDCFSVGGVNQSSELLGQCDGERRLLGSAPGDG